MAREQNLKNFPQNYFDYIIIDEFHHAAADSYQSVLEYFQPNFLLGLTATPYRTDNRDIYALCKDNVIYEIYLKDAINRDLLAPFRYFGIYDETDYSNIEHRNGKYVIDDLEKQLSRKERAGLVLEKYQLLAGQKTLAFCASINHADYMARYFNDKNVPSAAVHSGGPDNGHSMDRTKAVEALENGHIKIIFAVDIFNEGVDIPSVDTVMFLRPTESFVVFLQQLGRGLRKDTDKNHLTVLDFIGNYKRAHYIPEDVNELNAEESSWLDTPAEEFLKVIEKTAMSKAYKLPTIGALLEDNEIKKQVPLSRVGQNFMEFYTENKLHQKDLRDKSNKNWHTWGLKQFTNLAKRNPVHFLSKGKFFNYDEVNQVFYLSPELESYLNSDLAGHVKDILEYKRVDYFRKRFKESE